MHTTEGPRMQITPSRDSVERIPPQRPQEGEYELGGGGKVVYDFPNRNVSCDRIEEERTQNGSFKVNLKELALLLVITIVISAAAGAGVAFGVLKKTNTKEPETSMPILDKQVLFSILEYAWF